MCNLASIALPRFIKDGKYDYKKLYDITYTVTNNLNRVIDNNFYPIEEARNSNMRHRPIGLGVQVRHRIAEISPRSHAAIAEISPRSES